MLLLVERGSTSKNSNSVKLKLLHCIAEVPVHTPSKRNGFLILDLFMRLKSINTLNIIVLAVNSKALRMSVPSAIHLDSTSKADGVTAIYFPSAAVKIQYGTVSLLQQHRNDNVKKNMTFSEYKFNS